LRKQPDPELIASLFFLIPVRDNGWELATNVQHAEETLNENCRASAEKRLALALKHVGRGNEALQAKNYVDADFWLLAAGYEFSFATVYATRSTPCPSHILEQMKKVSKSRHYKFQEWANSIGLELSSREACENRIEGMAVLYDLMKSTEPKSDLASSLSKYRMEESFQIVKNKATYLLDQRQMVDSYAYLGLEAVKTLTDLLAVRAANSGRDVDYATPITSLTVGERKIISEELIHSIGIQRSVIMLEEVSRALSGAIAHQARRV
jgi:hypothetical protein